MSELFERVAGIRRRMAVAAERAGRSPNAVVLVAATKTISPDRLREAVSAGVSDLGENRVQEAEEKIAALEGLGVRWHFIGHLQSNKVMRAIQLFDTIHSIDSLPLAAMVSRRARAHGQQIRILFEINVPGERSKQGFAADQLLDAAKQLRGLPNLVPLGLMTVAPLVANPEEVRPVFRQLRQLRDRLTESFDPACFHELSMGMTNDFEVAIEEGATMVRLGTAIFGPRRQ